MFACFFYYSLFITMCVHFIQYLLVSDVAKIYITKIEISASGKTAMTIFDNGQVYTAT